MAEQKKQKPAGPPTRTIRRTITEEIQEFDGPTDENQETDATPTDDEDGDDTPEDDDE